MDPSAPLTVVSSALASRVVQGLAATSAWISGAQVHRMARAGSEAGVRKVLRRLVAQGVVDADEHTHATLYRLNRDHVSTEAILQLLEARARIIQRIAADIDGWDPPVLHASIFGSFARGEAGEDSDIDILVVHADTDPDVLAMQIYQLAEQVRRWSGNPAQVIDITADRLAGMVSALDPLVESWRNDAVHVSGTRLLHLIREVQR